MDLGFRFDEQRGAVEVAAVGTEAWRAVGVEDIAVAAEQGRCRAGPSPSASGSAAGILALYATLLCGGVLLVARLVGGYTPPNAALGLPLLLLEGTVLLTLALLGGTRLSTLANGVTVFGLYGLAFVGGWMEQIGTVASNATARYVGIGASLLVPSESLWQLASHHMQPPLVRDIGIGPFSPLSVPSPAMVGWAVGYVLVTLALALRLFRTRDL